MVHNIQFVVFIISKLGDKNYVAQIVGNKDNVTNKNMSLLIPTLETNARRHPKPRSVTLLISSDENCLIPLLKKTTYWLIMMHLADGFVNVAFQLL